MAVEGEIKEQAISRKMAEYMKTSTRYAPATGPEYLVRIMRS